MHDFKHHRATDTAGAVSALKNADDGKYLAGGQTLIPVMKQGLAMPSDMIDLGGIPDFKGISVDGEAVSIGAMTTHAEVAASDDVRRAIPALAGLAGKIGDPHVRNRGTLGGSIANADPAADYPAALVGLGATIRTDRVDGHDAPVVQHGGGLGLVLESLKLAFVQHGGKRKNF